MADKPKERADKPKERVEVDPTLSNELNGLQQEYKKRIDAVRDELDAQVAKLLRGAVRGLSAPNGEYPDDAIVSETWFSSDHNYAGYDTHHMPPVNHDHGGHQSPPPDSGTFGVPDDRRIVGVRYALWGAYAGWCYNPNPNLWPTGQYGLAVDAKEGGTQVVWHRLYDGLPVSEVYLVFYRTVV